MLPRGCAPVTEARGHRRLAAGEVRPAARLLLAGHLVPVPLWRGQFLLHPGAGETLGPLSGLGRDADLPAFLQAGDSALACCRAGEVAGSGRGDALAFAYLSADEAGGSQHRAVQVQPRGCREAFLAADPDREQRDSRSLPPVCRGDFAAAPGTLRRAAQAALGREAGRGRFAAHGRRSAGGQSAVSGPLHPREGSI